MRSVAANCCLSHLRCCSVAITTIAMVMSSAHESSATPVYERRGKTNPACQSLCGYTQTHHHMHDPVNMYTHTHTGAEGTDYIEEKSSVIRSLVGSVGGQRLRTETQKDADRNRLI